MQRADRRCGVVLQIDDIDIRRREHLAREVPQTHLDRVVEIEGVLED